MDEAGINRSAILLMSLGEDEAGEVFKHLGPKEVQKLGTAMAALKSVSKDEVGTVLTEFRNDAGSQASLSGETGEYLRSVLTKALGNEKAGYLLDRILQGTDTSGIESLKWMDSPTVAELIKDEHPQIIASILVHLERDQAAEILNCFSERLRGDVILRISTLDGIQPTALRELNEALSKVLLGADSLKKTAMGGVRVAADILNFLGSKNEASVMESVREHDADLAQKILDEMFVFDNLMDLDDRAIQLVLREVQSESLILALKGTSEEMRNKIFSNMSQRAAEMLKDDLESKGPVKVSEVETEQKEILKIVRRLVEEGQVSLGGGGDDAYV
jgi:flagellar motor switch protein FliG